ncbi:hypothetical protein M5K25_004449 [Dendrobium thyrsiflorum]|uniref:Uncharacterized protein n=1 Tax=Dendrobium thyrsiflorum TaxID=117978 RepID=A0ABD0VTH7_DENTH
MVQPVPANQPGPSKWDRSEFYRSKSDNVAWLNISMKNSRNAIVMQKLEIFTLAENFRNPPCEQIIPKVNHLQVLASTPIARNLAFQYHPWSPKNFKIRQSRYTIRNSTLETIEVINVYITLTTLLHSNRVLKIQATDSNLFRDGTAKIVEGQRFDSRLSTSRFSSSQISLGISPEKPWNGKERTLSCESSPMDAKRCPVSRRVGSGQLRTVGVESGHEVAAAAEMLTSTTRERESQESHGQEQWSKLSVDHAARRPAGSETELLKRSSASRSPPRAKVRRRRRVKKEKVRSLVDISRRRVIAGGWRIPRNRKIQPKPNSSRD